MATRRADYFDDYFRRLDDYKQRTEKSSAKSKTGDRTDRAAKSAIKKLGPDAAKSTMTAEDFNRAFSGPNKLKMPKQNNPVRNLALKGLVEVTKPLGGVGRTVMAGAELVGGAADFVSDKTHASRWSLDINPGKGGGGKGVGFRYDKSGDDRFKRNADWYRPDKKIMDPSYGANKLLSQYQPYKNLDNNGFAAKAVKAAVNAATELVAGGAGTSVGPLAKAVDKQAIREAGVVAGKSIAGVEAQRAAKELSRRAAKKQIKSITKVSREVVGGETVRSREVVSRLQAASEKALSAGDVGKARRLGDAAETAARKGARAVSKESLADAGIEYGVAWNGVRVGGTEKLAHEMAKASPLRAGKLVAGKVWDAAEKSDGAARSTLKKFDRSYMAAGTKDALRTGERKQRILAQEAEVVARRNTASKSRAIEDKLAQWDKKWGRKVRNMTDDQKRDYTTAMEAYGRDWKTWTPEERAAMRKMQTGGFKGIVPDSRSYLDTAQGHLGGAYAEGYFPRMQTKEAASRISADLVDAEDKSIIVKKIGVEHRRLAPDDEFAGRSLTAAEQSSGGWTVDRMNKAWQAKYGEDFYQHAPLEGLKQNLNQTKAALLKTARDKEYLLSQAGRFGVSGSRNVLEYSGGTAAEKEAAIKAAKKAKAQEIDLQKIANYEQQTVLPIQRARRDALIKQAPDVSQALRDAAAAEASGAGKKQAAQGIIPDLINVQSAQDYLSRLQGMRAEAGNRLARTPRAMTREELEAAVTPLKAELTANDERIVQLRALEPKLQELDPNVRAKWQKDLTAAEKKQARLRQQLSDAEAVGKAAPSAGAPVAGTATGAVPGPQEAPVAAPTKVKAPKQPKPKTPPLHEDAEYIAEKFKKYMADPTSLGKRGFTSADAAELQKHWGDATLGWDTPAKIDKAIEARRKVGYIAAGAETPDLPTAAASVSIPPTLASSVPSADVAAVSPTAAQAGKPFDRVKVERDLAATTQTVEDLRSKLTSVPPNGSAFGNVSAELTAATEKSADLKQKILAEQAKFNPKAAAQRRSAEARAATLDKQIDDAKFRLDQLKGTKSSLEQKRLQLLTEAKDHFADADLHRAMANDALATHDALLGHARAMVADTLQVAKDMGKAASVQRSIVHDSLAKYDSITSKWASEVIDVVDRGWKALGPAGSGNDLTLVGKGAHEQEFYKALHELQKPQGWNNFFKGADALLSRWKAARLFTPGYHIRNYMGAVFTNWTRGVEWESYGLWTRTNHQFQEALKKNGGDVDRALLAVPDGVLRNGIRAAYETGAVGTKASSVDFIDAMDGGTRGILGKRLEKVDPTSLNNYGFKASHWLGNTIEDHVRGTQFLDAYLKNGGDARQAFMRTIETHYDAHWISQFEHDWARRVIPFYTWTRQNLPAMLETMALHPTQPVALWRAKEQLEQGVPLERFPPSFLASQFNVRLPFTQNGSRVYLTPDLPMVDALNWFGDPRGKALGMTAPWLQFAGQLGMRGGEDNTPWSIQYQDYFSPDLKEAGGLKGLVGRYAAPILNHIPGMEVKGGKMNDFTSKSIDSFLPFVDILDRTVMPWLGKNRSDPRDYEKRAAGTLSSVGGLSQVANTPSMQAAADYERARKINSKTAKLVKAGVKRPAAARDTSELRAFFNETFAK